MSSEQLGIKILKCLVTSPKTNRELLEDLCYDKTKFNAIDKPLKKLNYDGFVKSKKIDSSGPGAKPTLNYLNPDLKTLAYLVNNVYDDESILDLMDSKYYHDRIQTIIDHLSASTNYELIIQDREFLGLVLKYSQTSLKLVLSDDLNKKLASIGGRMDLVDFGSMNVDALYKSAILTTLHNTESSEAEATYGEILNCVRHKMKILKGIGADNQKNHYLVYVFNKIFESDLFTDKIPSSLSAAFCEDHMKMGTILKKCEDSTVYSMAPV
ncbi:hypothetical protein [Methanococcoides methylutens]|uniref:Uncharacterized protein n=1 Tax=Methanococcoides methylutens MM1 TaxID=1434104 RepID=A0A0E3SQZ4_METMT|nr:hypothetical protein [Methanococcoides methylutens]AKB84517.1 hypothetical protein MCMEM_0464 [Methanococcoides methylutens MM1]